MFFIVAKTVGFLAAPSNALIVLGLAGVLLMATRWARLGRRLAAGSVVGLAVFGWSPFGNALILPLEQRFPPWDRARGAPAGIIIAGGAISPGVSASRASSELNEAAERMTVGADLARRYPSARVVYTGGNGRLTGGSAGEAPVAGRLLQSLGIAPGRLMLEGRSRDTSENAEFTRQLVAPKPGERWLLVTSAYHMPRAIGCFRRAGFSVEAYPVDWRSRGAADLTEPFDKLSAGLARSDVAVREWIGLMVYWITGRTSALWPGP